MDAAKGGIARQTNTDQSGRFQAIDIQPGKYVITVEKTGFKKAEVAVTLDVNAKLDVGQIKLEVGNVTRGGVRGRGSEPRWSPATPWKRRSWWTAPRSRNCP